MNRNAIALFSILLGIAFLISLAIFISSFPVFAQTYNLAPFRFVLFVFALGVYLASSLPWVYSRRPRDISPFIVTLGAMGGGLVGYAGTMVGPLLGLSALVHLLVSPALALAPTSVDIVLVEISHCTIFWLYSIVGALVGARLGAVVEVSKPKSPVWRLAIVLAGTALLLLPLLLVHRPYHRPSKVSPALTNGLKLVDQWVLLDDPAVRNPVDHMVVSPDGNVALVGKADSLELWDLVRGEKIRTLALYNHLVELFMNHEPLPSKKPLAFSPDGGIAIAAGGYGTYSVTLWDAKSGIFIRTFRGHKGRVKAMAVSPGGALLLTGRAAGATAPFLSKDFDQDVVRLWDVRNGKEVRTPQSVSKAVDLVSFSSDGRRAMATSLDTIAVWEAEAGREVARLKEEEGFIYSAAALSADGTRVLWGLQFRTGARSTKGDYPLRLWDVERGREVLRLSGHTKPVRFVTSSADGRRAFSLSDDGELKIWDLQSGQELRSLKGGNMTLSPNRRFAVSGSDRLSVWDLSKGEELGEIDLGQGQPRVRSTVFPADDYTFFVATVEGLAFRFEISR